MRKEVVIIRKLDGSIQSLVHISRDFIINNEKKIYPRIMSTSNSYHSLTKGNNKLLSCNRGYNYRDFVVITRVSRHKDESLYRVQKESLRVQPLHILSFYRNGTLSATSYAFSPFSPVHFRQSATWRKIVYLTAKQGLPGAKSESLRVLQP